MTPNRGIDADFTSLPRRQLADAALAAATAAGASHADLRIQRLVNEVIQLRDGELETAVLNREIVAKGYAPAAKVEVNRTDLIQSTQDLRYKTRVRPYTYIKYIENELGFQP